MVEMNLEILKRSIFFDYLRGMKFFTDSMIGIRSYWDAMLFIHKKKWHFYILIPAVLMLFIYKIGDLLRNRSIGTDFETMNGIVWYLIQLFITISISILLMKFTKYLVVIILSPLLAYLGQKCETELTGKQNPFNFKQLESDIKRSFRIVIRNMMWEYLFFVIIFIIAYLIWGEINTPPVIFITFIIGFFYYGFSFIDYTNERRRLDVDQSILFMRDHRGLAVVIGGVYSLLLFIPVDISAIFSIHKITTISASEVMQFVLNLFLWIAASAAPILAIVASTLAMHKVVDLNQNDFAIKKPE